MAIQRCQRSNNNFQKYARNPPNHTRQNYEQLSDKMWLKFLEKRKSTVFGHIFVQIFALYVGIGTAKRFPKIVLKMLRPEWPHAIDTKIFITFGRYLVRNTYKHGCENLGYVRFA